MEERDGAWARKVIRPSARALQRALPPASFAVSIPHRQRRHSRRLATAPGGATAPARCRLQPLPQQVWRRGGRPWRSSARRTAALRTKFACSFLAADFDAVNRLRNKVHSTLAWQSIVADIKDLKLDLDRCQAQQATRRPGGGPGGSTAHGARNAAVGLLAPMQEARPGKGLSEIQWESSTSMQGHPT